MNQFKQHWAALAVMAGMLIMTVSAQADDAQLLQRGAYLATAGDCIACHSTPTGKPFAGGLAIATPVGQVISTNITPSISAGIGNYTLVQFSAALRRGVRVDGQHLYPAIPYTSYAQLSDEDVQALYVYFEQGVTAVDDKPVATALPFPFNIRLSMAAWNLLFLDDKPFVPDPGKSVEWNRGAYLVEGLAHCSTCHTPRTLLMGEDKSLALAGADLGTWYAPNISTDDFSGIGTWSEAQIAEYLRSGRLEGKAQAGGPMAEAIDHSLRHLSDADRLAMATYLKTVAPQHDIRDSQAAHTWGQPYNGIGALRGAPVALDTSKFNGAQLYDANCASCHRANGEGSAQWGGKDGASLPSLFHNTTLGHRNSNNLVMAILEGVQRQPGGAEVLMPAFGRKLNDEQIASLSNYLLPHYGNFAAEVSVEQVKTLRAGGATSSLLIVARTALGVLALIIIGALLLLWGRRRFKRARPGANDWR